jgi:hypothetical protein
MSFYACHVHGIQKRIISWIFIINHVSGEFTPHGVFCIYFLYRETPLLTTEIYYVSCRPEVTTQHCIHSYFGKYPLAESHQNTVFLERGINEITPQILQGPQQIIVGSGKGWMLNLTYEKGFSMFIIIYWQLSVVDQTTIGFSDNS